MTATDSLAVALDRFDAPPLSPGLGDRIAAAATGVLVPPRRRDRRGSWRRVRQVGLTAVAAAMLSAAAVASGLLDSSGVHVPVLTAMLLPTAHDVQPRREKKPVVAFHRPAQTGSTSHALKASPDAPIDPVVAWDSKLSTRQLMRRELAAERRDARVAFIQAHPRAAMMIARNVERRLRQREARSGGAFVNAVPVERDGVLPSVSARQEAPSGRQFRRQALAVAIDRRIAKQARLGGEGSIEASPIPRARRQGLWQQITAAERADKQEMMAERRAARQAFRRQQQSPPDGSRP